MDKSLIFVLSDRCDHSKILVPDSGPDYAEAMGYETRQLKDCDWRKEHVWIIDIRLEEDEFAVVDRAIRQHPRTVFLLRAIDPYFEDVLRHINTRFLFRHLGSANAGYLSGYHPEEAGALLAEGCRDSGKFFVCPNAYDERRELPLDDAWFQRTRKIAFCGAQNPKLYIYRAFFLRKMKTDIRWWGKVATLPHPGYADIGQKPKHNIKGDAFIEWMALHQTCFLCPGRCHLEFIKYRECAYAGCAPVGVAPKTMSEEVARQITPLDWIDYTRKRDTLLKMPAKEIYERAKAYRAGFARDRGPALLREKLCDAVARWRAQS